MFAQPPLGRMLGVFSVLAAAAVMTASVAVGQKAGDKEYGGIDAKVVAAWKKAGAEFGWLFHDKGGYVEFADKRPAEGPALPAFRMGHWPTTGLKGLPA